MPWIFWRSPKFTGLFGATTACLEQYGMNFQDQTQGKMKTILQSFEPVFHCRHIIGGFQTRKGQCHLILLK